MELYIIRHAQSTNNVSMIYNSTDRVADPPLTELGFRQAETVAHYLSTTHDIDRWVDQIPESNQLPHGFNFTKLYCSPMLRTLQTCLPISRKLNMEAEVWVDLHEHGGIHLDYGDVRGVVGFPGLGRTAIQDQFTGFHVPPLITDDGWYNPAHKAEDIATCMGRAVRVAHAIRQHTSTNERIALVTHGTFTDVLLKSLLNMLPNHTMRFSHYNTAITRLDFSPDGHVKLRYLNRIAHLPPDMVS
ncbi:MAG: histidine phosphatase family protein [Anaerolineae bacterium]